MFGVSAMFITNLIDARDTMYPTYAMLIDEKYDSTPVHAYSTVYGYCFGETDITHLGDAYNLKAGDYFSLPLTIHHLNITPDAPVFLIYRLGYQGIQQIGRTENKGRLSYIDGCSSTILVPPPRKGDPCFNLLHFPQGTDQSGHTHPSIRIGVVASGEGIAYADHDVKPLRTGDMFFLLAHEMHRFVTAESEMRIIAYHPDSDWGPTDQDHAMLSRTYLK
jgi:quercetin dioxygenase-like cupin family protein